MRPYFTPYPMRYMPYPPPQVMNRGFFPPPYPMVGPPPQIPTSPFNIGQFMTQANHFMQTAQKYAPFIKEARPIIKNLPALWKLYKGFSSQPQEPVRTSRTKRVQQDQPRRSRKHLDEHTTQPSLPKIYQPK